MRTLFLAIFSSVIFSGCALFGPPVIDQSVGGSSILGTNGAMGALATTTEYRTINAVTNKHLFGGYCPEPPADTAVTKTTETIAALEATIDKISDSQQKADLTRKVAETLVPLLRRSQGLQYHRDGLYYLCVIALNDTVRGFEFDPDSKITFFDPEAAEITFSREQLLTHMKHIHTEAKELITAEIEHLNEINMTSSVSPRIQEVK